MLTVVSFAPAAAAAPVYLDCHYPARPTSVEPGRFQVVLDEKNRVATYRPQLDLPAPEEWKGMRVQAVYSPTEVVFAPDSATITISRVDLSLVVDFKNGAAVLRGSCKLNQPAKRMF